MVYLLREQVIQTFLGCISIWRYMYSSFYISHHAIKICINLRVYYYNWLDCSLDVLQEIAKLRKDCLVFFFGFIDKQEKRLCDLHIWINEYLSFKSQFDDIKRMQRKRFCYKQESKDICLQQCSYFPKKKSLV